MKYVMLTKPKKPTEVELLLIDVFNHINLAGHEALCMWDAAGRTEDMGEMYDSIHRKLKLAMDKVNKLLEIERREKYGDR